MQLESYKETLNQLKAKLAEIEQDESLIIVYQDEVHFLIQTIVTAGWFKKGNCTMP